jgi:hypothetical protein
METGQMARPSALRITQMFKFKVIAFSKDAFRSIHAEPGVVIAKFKTREAAEKRAREKNIAGRGIYMAFPIDA